MAHLAARDDAAGDAAGSIAQRVGPYRGTAPGDRPAEQRERPVPDMDDMIGAVAKWHAALPSVDKDARPPRRRFQTRFGQEPCSDQGLGDRFTPEVAAAWTEAYTLLATSMQQPAPLAA